MLLSRSLSRVAVAGAVLLTACSDRTPAAPDAPDALEARAAAVPVIVVLDPSFAPGGHAANQAAAADVAGGLGLTPGHAYGSALFGFAAAVPEGRLNALDRDPRVLYWERDQTASIPRPVAEARPGGGGSGGETEPWGITRVGGPASGAGKLAYVIDTGVDLDHPDLNVDLACSKNFVSKGKDSPDDGNGHGTHVAGTIAAIDNDRDVVGVAAGASICSVRVLDNAGFGSYSDIIAGVDYVGSRNATGAVANMSLGGGPSAALDQAVGNASSKVSFALAAGNSGADAGNYSPARVNGPNVYTIAAIASNNCLTSWSNWGNPPVDYAAPGSGILSLKRGGGTTTLSGTSMAAPHVAGILLLGAVKSDGSACENRPGSYPIAHR